MFLEALFAIECPTISTFHRFGDYEVADDAVKVLEAVISYSVSAYFAIGHVK